MPLKPHGQPRYLIPGTGISGEIDHGNRCKRLTLLHAATSSGRKKDTPYPERLESLHEGSRSIVFTGYDTGDTASTGTRRPVTRREMSVKTWPHCFQRSVERRLC